VERWRIECSAAGEEGNSSSDSARGSVSQSARDRLETGRKIVAAWPANMTGMPALAGPGSVRISSVLDQSGAAPLTFSAHGRSAWIRTKTTLVSHRRARTACYVRKPEPRFAPASFQLSIK
jgi:hypothetical protein